MTQSELPMNDRPPRNDRSLDRRDWLLRALFLVPIGGIAVLGLITTLAIRKTDRTLRPILSEASLGDWAPAREDDVAAFRIASAAAAARDAERFLPYTDVLFRANKESARLPTAVRELSEIRRMLLPEDVTVRPGTIATALRQLQSEASQSYPDDAGIRIQLALQKRQLEEAEQEIKRLKQQATSACPNTGVGEGVSGSAAVVPRSTTACENLGVLIQESPYRIYFNSGRAELTPTERQVVAFVVKSWHERGKPAVIVAGYTDLAGMDAVNSQLRARRAALVAAALELESSGELRAQIVHRGAAIPGLAKIKDNDERARVALIWFQT